MLIEAAIGKFAITAAKDNDNVIVASDNIQTLMSLADGVELMAGEEGNDQTFSLSDIHSFTLFGKPRHEIELTKAQLFRFLQYEVLNFLTYSSLTQMRHL